MDKSDDRTYRHYNIFQFFKSMLEPEMTLKRRQREEPSSQIEPYLHLFTLLSHEYPALMKEQESIFGQSNLQLKPYLQDMIGSILHDTEPNVAEKFILNSYADNVFNILDIENLVKMLSQRSNLTKRQKLMSIARWLQADREDKDSMHTSIKWINNYSEFYN